MENESRDSGLDPSVRELSVLLIGEGVRRRKEEKNCLEKVYSCSSGMQISSDRLARLPYQFLYLGSDPRQELLFMYQVSIIYATVLDS